MKEQPENIRLARCAIDHVSGAAWVTPFEWHEECEVWYACLEIRLCLQATGHVPQITQWYVLLDDEYPLGGVDVYPAEADGIHATFPHQRANLPPRSGRLWRTGKLCLDDHIASLGRLHDQSEPTGACDRLEWHLRRTKDWLELASQDKLVDATDHLELPDYPAPANSDLIVFSETALTFSQWKQAKDNVGHAFVVEIKTDPRILAVTSFQSLASKPICRTKWEGRVLVAERLEQVPDFVAWMRVTAPVFLEPWAAPVTWGQLWQALAAQGNGHEQIVRKAVRVLRSTPVAFRFLLIGFPLPKLVSGNPEQMHWLAVKLDGLSGSGAAPKGFRPTDTGKWLRDKLTAMAPNKPVIWARTENWSENSLQGRGQLPDPIRLSKALLVGAGAVGSHLAELLVRGGLRSLTVVDSDRVAAGNLTRHTLSLRDVDANKATALAMKLMDVSPHSRVDAEACTMLEFTRKSHGVLDHEIVLDCTADDGVLNILAHHQQTVAKVYASISVGHYAKRLFVFLCRSRRFPLDTFKRLGAQWWAKEREESKDVDYPRDGLGCWHPLFPASAIEVWTMTGVAANAIVDYVTQDQQATLFLVFERSSDGSIVRVADEQAV